MDSARWRGISQADHSPRTTGRATVYGQTLGAVRSVSGVITFQQLTTSGCALIGKISVPPASALFVSHLMPTTPLSKVGYPQHVRRDRIELPLHQTIRAMSLRISDGGAPDLASSCTFEPENAHQPFDRAPRYLDALSPQLKPHLAGAVDRIVLGMHTADLGFELLVAHGPPRCRTIARLAIGPHIARLAICGRRNRAAVLAEHPAYRLDAVLALVSVDDADFRISLARLSSRFSVQSSRLSDFWWSGRFYVRGWPVFLRLAMSPPVDSAG